MEVIIGAEAVVEIHSNKVIKKRVSKKYRHPQLDLRLNQERMRNEKRLLVKSKRAGILVPTILNSDETNLSLEKINGKNLKDNLTTKVIKKVGIQIRKIHQAGLIHGDLTTSNIIIKENEPYFIDFGLGFESEKIEEKAVDLHVLEESVNAQVPQKKDELLKSLLDGYADKRVLKRLQKVRNRGRYK